ncbi:MAG: hypothetical protein IKI11_03905 [Neisseriaceae bacterium]|nr:hypothetical protein [Neisseriaceae bacterium]
MLILFRKTRCLKYFQGACFFVGEKVLGYLKIYINALSLLWWAFLSRAT